MAYGLSGDPAASSGISWPASGCVQHPKYVYRRCNNFIDDNVMPVYNQFTRTRHASRSSAFRLFYELAGSG
ncbi:hypothetical protein GCM10007905_29820 [Mixta theicola]|nr:hypothetical protein GCM10007905_29820 [Mixta theicola]